MTQHDSDVKALIKAARTACDVLVDAGYESIDVKNLKAALAKLEPKPEKVYVLDELWPTAFETLMQRKGFDLYHITLDDLWHELRELTATDAPVQT